MSRARARRTLGAVKTAIRIRGAEHLDLDAEQSLQLLVLLFGNGLDGDVRLEGGTADAVEVLRALTLGVGSCAPIAAPTDSSLYVAGDECFRQHPTARVFLCPTPVPLIGGAA